MAEKTEDPAVREACQTFIIIGAGPTGVELAGIIAELARNVLPSEFRHIDTRKARVILVEAGPRVLPAFPDDLSQYARESLEELGVEVRTGSPVTECRAEGIVLDGELIPANTTLWAAGVKASRAGSWLDAVSDRAGRVVVEPNLTVPENPNIFVIGDTAAVNDNKGKPVPGIAPAAKQQGFYVAKVIAQRLKHKAAPRPFRYRHSGNLATIGPGAAVVDFGKIRLKGSLAWWAWGIAHIYFLIGTRSRLAVANSWLWSYLTGQKSARLITRAPAPPEETESVPRSKSA